MMTRYFGKRTQNLLIDTDILALVKEGKLFKSGFDESLLGGIAYDLRAGTVLASRNRAQTYEINDEDYVVVPGEIVTIETIEEVDFADPLVAGLIISNHTQVSSGFFHPTTSVDAGFQGRLSLTLMNVGNTGYPVRARNRIAKLIIIPVYPGPERLYGVGQHPRVREGSIKHALVVDRRESHNEIDLPHFFGGPIGILARQVEELEKRIQSERATRELSLYRRVAYGIGVIILGATGAILADNYWSSFLRWMQSFFE
jgi:deoxycytidine triphosphate deaminase